MFQALGCIGLVYVFFYAFFVKQVKPAEEEKAGAKKGSKKEYFLKLLHFSIIWKLVVCAFCISRINKGLDAWMPTYLIAERGINLKAVGYVTPIPFMASFLSTAVCGWIMNKYFDRVEQYMIGICAVMTAVFLYLMYNAETLFWVVMGYLVSVFNGSFNAVFYYLIGAASVCALSAFLIPERKEAMLDLGEGS